MGKTFLAMLILGGLLLVPKNNIAGSDLPINGEIHTRVYDFDTKLLFHDGSRQYNDAVTIVEITASVEVWNTASYPQQIGYNWYTPSCGYYLKVIANISDDNTGIYDGEPVYQTVCDSELKSFEPGLTQEIGTLKLVFNSLDLSFLPSGEYFVSAPTNNGTGFITILRSNDNIISYEMEGIPDNWGEINIFADECVGKLNTGLECGTTSIESENPSETFLVPLSVSSLMTVFLIPYTLRYYKSKKLPNFQSLIL